MTSTTPEFKLGYTPAFDGMRGIAVLMVMLSHSGMLGVDGGFIGVDIFFVLSGFFITALLLKEYDTYHSINLKNFYMRRLLRLLPALIALLLFLLVISTLFLDDAKANQTRIDVLFTLFYFSNWATALDWNTPLYLAHTWSLAIEEQFYIFFPVLLILLLRFLKRNAVLKVVTTLGLCSWVWRSALLLLGAPNRRIYFALDTRLDGLLLGCALAILFSTDAYAVLLRLYTRFPKQAFAIAILACLVLACICVTVIGGYLYLNVSIANLLTLYLITYISMSSTNPLKRALEFQPLVYIGRVSYGLYLWHVIVYKILTNTIQLPLAGVVVIGTLLTFGIGFVSYRLIELPALKLKSRFPAAPSIERVQPQRTKVSP